MNKPIVRGLIIGSLALLGMLPKFFAGGETDFSNLWVLQQNEVQHSSEIARDAAQMQQLIGQLSTLQKMSKAQIFKELQTHAAKLAGEIPFSFPERYYRVFCINEQKNTCPFPYHVYQRLYLGDTELGFPFYLDVRVYDLKNATDAESIVEWYLSQLVEGKTAFESYQQVGYTAYLGRGYRKNLQVGERGIYLKVAEKNNKLFVAYADAPWATFSAHVSLFKPS